MNKYYLVKIKFYTSHQKDTPGNYEQILMPEG